MTNAVLYRNISIEYGESVVQSFELYNSNGTPRSFSGNVITAEIYLSQRDYDVLSPTTSGLAYGAYIPTVTVLNNTISIEYTELLPAGSYKYHIKSDNVIIVSGTVFVASIASPGYGPPGTSVLVPPGSLANVPEILVNGDSIAKSYAKINFKGNRFTGTFASNIVTVELPNFSNVAITGSYTDLTNKPVLFSGSYTDLTNKPTIPAAQVNSDWNAVSGVAQILNKPALFSGSYTDLTNKPVLFSGAYADLSGKPTLFSGSYTDLTNKPTIPAAQVNSDWNAVSGVAEILNKPALFSGSYIDLTNKPTLFSGAYSDLSGKPTIPVYVKDYGTDATAINAAIAAAVAQGKNKVVFDSSTTYQITQPITISNSNLTLCGEGCTINQQTWGHPVLLVVVDNVRIENFNFTSSTVVKSRITSWVGTNYATLYNQRSVQRDYCAGVVSLNCHQTEVIECNIDGFFCGATFFGIYNGGVNPVRGRNHRMIGCKTTNCDMGILAYLTDSAIVSNNYWSDIPWTQPTAPPHGCYFSVERQSDGDYTEGDDHFRLVYINNIAVNNPFSSGHKIKATRNSVVANNTADRCQRGYDIDYCFNTVFSNLNICNPADYVWPTEATHPNFGATSTAANQYLYNGGVIVDSQASGINIVDSSDCNFSNLYLEKNQVDSFDTLLFRLGDNGGTNRIRVSSVNVQAYSEPGLSGSLMNNAAFVSNCTAIPRLTIFGVDLVNNLIITTWPNAVTILPNGSLVKVRTPLSGATPPGGLVVGTNYYSKASVTFPERLELYTDAGLTQRVTITSASTGGTVFMTTPLTLVDPVNDMVNVNWDPVTGSIPDGSPVILSMPIKSSTVPGGLSLGTVYYSKQSTLATGWIEFYTDSALTQKVDITSVGYGQLRIDTGVLVASAVDVNNNTIDLGVTVSNIFSNGTPIRLYPQQDNGSVLPGGLDANTIYYAKSTNTLLTVYSDSALTQVVDITSTGTGVLQIHTVKVPSGYAVNYSSCSDCTVENITIKQNGTSSDATGARLVRLSAGALRCHLLNYRVIGTTRHGQIDAGATDCVVSLSRNLIGDSNFYSNSWIDSGGINCKAEVSATNTPVGFSSNVSTPTIGDASTIYATNASTTTYLTDFLGWKWLGRTIRIYSSDSNTKIATGNTTAGATASVSTTNDDINLSRGVSQLFPDGTPLTITSSGSGLSAIALLAGGSGYTNSTQATSGGTGTGRTVTITTSGGVITSVVQASAGSGYTNGDVLTIAGGTGGTVVVYLGTATSTVYAKTGARGATYLELYRDVALTSKLDITAAGGGTLTIKAPSANAIILSDAQYIWSSDRATHKWIELTYRNILSGFYWCQTGGGDNPIPSGGIAGQTLIKNSSNNGDYSWQTTVAPVNADWNASSGLAQILNKPTIPAAQVNSDWNAVSGVSQILNKPTIPAAPVNADWNAGSGLAQILNKPTLFSGSYTDLTNKPTIPAAQVNSDWNSVSGVSQILNKPTLFSGSYTDLTNKPTIPAAQVNSDWNAVSGLAQILNKPTLFSGSYTDLTNKPTIPAAQVNSDWNAVSGLAQILNKPTLFSGSYTDLTNKPSIPSAISIIDESTTLTSAPTSIAFAGAGVTATNTGGAVTVTIPGGGGGGGVTDHGALTGLSDDDHPQYSLASGARAFTGTVSLTGNGSNISVANGSLVLGGTSTVNTTTPRSSSVPTKIDIPVYDAPAFGQVISLGIGQNSAVSSRVLSIFDDRRVAHQPTLAIFNPSESDLVGFSWEGTDGFAHIKSLGARIVVNANDGGAVSFQGGDMVMAMNSATVPNGNPPLNSLKFWVDSNYGLKTANNTGVISKVVSVPVAAGTTNNAVKMLADGTFTVAQINYSEIANPPSIPAAQVNSDWNASSGLAQILNKPTIPSAITIQEEGSTLTSTPTSINFVGAALTATNVGNAITVTHDPDPSADQRVFGFLPGAPDVTISFNPANYTFTITPTGSTWVYWRNSVKYTVTGAKSVVLPGTPPAADEYFVYIDATDGTLSVATSPWILNDINQNWVPVALIEWNDALTPKFQMYSELHSCSFTRGLHAYHHLTEGSKWTPGGGVLSGFTLATLTDAACTFGITSGTLYDEDIRHDIPGIADGNGSGTPYTIRYRSGATWAWVSSAVPFAYTPGGYINYDNAGTLTQANNSNGNFITTYLLATPNGYQIIQGQTQYTSVTTAEAENWSSLAKPITVLEFTVLYKFVWETRTSGSNLGRVRLTSVRDLSISPTGIGASGAGSVSASDEGVLLTNAVTSFNFVGNSLTATNSGGAVTVTGATLAPVATSGSYTDLSNQPSIPAAQVNSDWNASSGVAQILNKPTIPAAQVNSDWNSVSGVSQILNKPTIPAAQVNSDWNAVSGLAQILNKPTLFSGSYTDLTNKPTIPDAQVNSDWNAGSGVAQILNKPTIPSAISIIDESTTLTSTPTSIAFAGAGVTASNVGNAVTVTIPGGGGGGTGTNPQVVYNSTGYNISNSAVEALVGSVTLPANIVSTAGAGWLIDHNALYTNDTGATQTINYNVLVGSSSALSTTTGTISAAATERHTLVRLIVRRKTASTAYMLVQVFVSAASATLGNGAITATKEIDNVTFDWSVDNTINLRATLSSTSTSHTYNGKYTVSTFNGGYTLEEIQDAAAGMLTGGSHTGISFSYDDTNAIVNATVTGGSNVPVNLGTDNRTTTTIDVTSSTGTSATIPAATTSLAGLLTSADKTKLDGLGGGASIIAKDEGSNLTTNLASINFAGAGVTASTSGNDVTVTIPGGGNSIIAKDEGSNLTTALASINFAGAGVTASTSGNDVTVTIPGGGSSTSINGIATLSPIDMPPQSASAFDDEFYGYTLDSGWTLTNGTNAVLTVDNSWLKIRDVHNGGSGGLLTITRNNGTVSGNFTITARVDALLTQNNYQGCGLCLIDTGGKVVAFGMTADNSGRGMILNYWTTRTSYSSTPFIIGVSESLYTAKYLRITSDGTTLSFRQSADGVTFNEFTSAGISAFLAAGQLSVGIWVQNDVGGGVDPTIFVDWFRYEAAATATAPRLENMENRTIPRLFNKLGKALTVDANNQLIFSTNNFLDTSNLTIITPIVTPAALDANTNNYNPTGLDSARILKVSASTHVLLTGITAPSTDNRILTLINVGSFTITLRDQAYSTASTAANRFNIGNPEYALIPGTRIDLIYDLPSARWMLIDVFIPTRNALLTVQSNFCDFVGGNSGHPDFGLPVFTGTSAGWNASGASYTGRVGVCNATTGTTATGRSGYGTSGVTGLWHDTSKYMRYSSVIRSQGTLSDATHTYFVYVGFFDSFSAEPTDGFYFRYDYATNSGIWEILSRSNSVTLNTGATNTTVTYAINTWFAMDLIILPDRSGEAWINGTLVATVASGNMVAAGTSRAFGYGTNIRKTVGSSGARDIECDSVEFTQINSQIRTR